MKIFGFTIIKTAEVEKVFGRNRWAATSTDVGYRTKKDAAFTGDKGAVL